jgi:hypothetical protein
MAREDSYPLRILTRSWSILYGGGRQIIYRNVKRFVSASVTVAAHVCMTDGCLAGNWLQMTVFWGVTSCGLAQVHRRFRGA